MNVSIFERYVPEELPADDRGRILWGIRDRETGDFVWTDGELEAHTMRRGAQGWIDRQVYLLQLRTPHGDR